MNEASVATPLYPPIEPHRQGWLETGMLHRLYWEESGNPKGVPVVFLHGGPGAGCAPVHRRFFDPKHYRIVLFDQRGAGRSVPRAELSNNTTADLVADIEQLRLLLGVERWLVFGGSWGSTLALAYGQTFPERCLGFILRGVFLFRPNEVAWFLHGMGTIFPEPAQAFRDFLPEAERADLLGSYYRRLTDPDPAVHMPAAVAWCNYEEGCSRIFPDPPQRGAGGGGSAGALAMARIEAHYMRHDGFLAANQLLENIERLHGLPAVIVQGRYDIICPMVTAHALAAAWPSARFQVVADGGHAALETGLRSALVQAADRFRDNGGF
jgi:proline iminopeptidase